MPTRIFRSETGCQTPLGRGRGGHAGLAEDFLSGAWAAAVSSNPPAATAPSEPRPTLRKNERRELGWSKVGSFRAEYEVG